MDLVPKLCAAAGQKLDPGDEQKLQLGDDQVYLLLEGQKKPVLVVAVRICLAFRL